MSRPPPRSPLFSYTTLFRSALSPWQIFMSRIALPGALVPAGWTLCLLAGLLLIARGGRREALGLALAAGLALYTYPTLKLAARSEEHTSELQSQFHLVCRLL